MSEVRRGGVSVFLFRTDVEEAETASLLRLLDADELARAERFHFARDRSRFTAAHAGLRFVLARWLGVRPEYLRFAADPGGKPRLACPSAEALFFNLSYSGDIAAVAVSTELEIGIDIEADIEPFRGMTAPGEIMEYICGDSERAWIAAQQEPLRALLRLWTLKEALVKAEGSGLAIPLREVALDLCEPGRVLIQPPHWGAKLWFAREIAAPYGYATAVATLDRPPRTLTIHYQQAPFYAPVLPALGVAPVQTEQLCAPTRPA